MDLGFLPDINKSKVYGVVGSSLTVFDRQYVELYAKNYGFIKGQRAQNR